MSKHIIMAHINDLVMMSSGLEMTQASSSIFIPVVTQYDQSPMLTVRLKDIMPKLLMYSFTLGTDIDKID